MTIPIEITRYVYAGPYDVGDTIPLPFTYMEAEHVKLLKNTEALRFNIDYTVLGQNATLNVAISADDKVVAYRQTPLDNDSEFPQEAEFDSEKINDAIDKLTMQNQEQQDAIDRALKLDMDTDTTTIVGLPVPDPNKCLKWSADAKKLINSTYDPDSQVTTAAYHADRAEAAEEQARQYAALCQEIYNNLIGQIEEKVSEALGGLTMSKLTASEYEDLETKDANNLYIING